jgi:DNA-binding MarR family transcriptional regulator
MNAIFFGLKRAYHGTLRITRSALKRIGLTAARFDLLYALNERGGFSTTQSELRQKLGVSPPTVSRMLESLEQLGLVVRRRHVSDGRQRCVNLTPDGRRRIRLAMRRFIGSGHAQLTVDSALGGDRWFDVTHCFVAMGELESFLSRIRHAFRDFATVHYPWHPDD